jgi:hypothetical protein
MNFPPQTAKKEAASDQEAAVTSDSNYERDQSTTTAGVNTVPIVMPYKPRLEPIVQESDLSGNAYVDTAVTNNPGIHVAASNTPKRPGVSAATLYEAGIREVSATEAEVLLGYRSAGIAIPYRELSGAAVKVNGRPFNRLRLHQPSSSAKYLSPARSGCQAYFPPKLRQLLLPGCTLSIVEGEFKALALVEAGFPCVGIGGISSACPKNSKGEPELLSSIAHIIAEVRPAALAFIGDADTALIPEFAREALKLAKLAEVPVILPRIPFNATSKPAVARKGTGGGGQKPERAPVTPQSLSRSVGKELAKANLYSAQ